MGCDSAFGGFFKSGSDCGPNTTVSQETNSLTQTTTNNIKSAVSNSTTNVATFQGQNVSIIGPCCPGGIDIRQSTNATVKMKTSVDTEFTSNIKRKFLDSITQKIDNSSHTVNNMLNSAGGGRTTIDLKNNIARIVNNNDTQMSLSNTLTNLANAQNQNISIDCRSGDGVQIPDAYLAAGGKCVVSQDLVSALYADAAVKTLMKSIQDDDYMVELDSDLTNSGYTENQDVISQVTGMFGKFGLYIMIAVVVMVLFLPLVIFAFRSGGSKTPEVAPTVSQFLKSMKGRRRY